MQSKQESVTKEVKEEESLTRFGWNGKMEREREREREKTRGGKRKRKRKAEVLAIPYPTLLLYFRQTSPISIPDQKGTTD